MLQYALTGKSPSWIPARLHGKPYYKQVVGILLSNNTSSPWREARKGLWRPGKVEEGKEEPLRNQQEDADETPLFHINECNEEQLRIL